MVQSVVLALMLVEAEAEETTAANVVSLKRRRPASLDVSPKKMKTMLGAKKVAVSKRVKTPGVKLTARALGFVENADGVFVPLEKEKLGSDKKKRGRPLGFKNKNSSQAATEEEGGEAAADGSLVFTDKPACPSVKGKEKI